MNKNFENLKSGDTVFRMSLRGAAISTVHVERVTATQVVLVSGEKYRRSDGRLIGFNGGMWDSPPYLMQLDDPIALSRRHQQLHAAHAEAVKRLADSFKAYPTADNLAALRLRITEWDTHVFPTSRD